MQWPGHRSCPFPFELTSSKSKRIFETNVYRALTSGVFRPKGFWFRGLWQKSDEGFAFCGENRATDKSECHLQRVSIDVPEIINAERLRGELAVSQPRSGHFPHSSSSRRTAGASGFVIGMLTVFIQSQPPCRA